MYFTTTEGVRKISAIDADGITSTVVETGGAKALEATTSVIFDSDGFFTGNSKVGYRILWVRTDNNDNLIRGFPSSRTVLENAHPTEKAKGQLSFVIPKEVNSTDFVYQIYRTGVEPIGEFTSLSEIDPGDEMQFIFQANVTQSQLSVGTVVATDNIAEDTRKRGAFLYTNPVSGEGILNANDKPPIAKDMALFRGTTFYGNTRSRHSKALTLTDLTDFVSGTTKLTIQDGITSNTYTFIGATQIETITCLDSLNTTDGSYILANSALNERKYLFYANKGTATAPTGLDTTGRVAVSVDISAATTNEEVAAAFTASITALDDFTATNVAEVITVNRVKHGAVDAISDGLIATTYTLAITTSGAGEQPDTAEGGDVLLSSLDGEDGVEETARSLVRIINEDNFSLVKAFYLSGPTDVQGFIFLEANSVIDRQFVVSINDSDLLPNFDSTVEIEGNATAITASNPSTITSASHGLSTGDNIVIFSENTPTVNGNHIVTVLDSDNFTVSAEVSSVGTEAVFSKTTKGSDSNIHPNRVYYSKNQEPEAVPIVNYFDIGPKDEPIHRIITLRDSLFVLKEDGVYRITGQSTNRFSVTLFDSSRKLIAPNSVAILDNTILAMTTDGIASISNTGIRPISRPIENLIMPYSAMSNFKSITHAVSYETDNAYLLYIPTSEDDTVPATCYRYNSLTDTWTEWDRQDTSAVVNKDEDLLYVGSGSENALEVERKDNSRKNFSDQDYDVNILGITSDLLQIDNGTVVDAGDAMVQTQTLTIFKFNQLLEKLDLDDGVTDNDYLTTLGVVTGDNLFTNIIALTVKLDLDAGVTDTDYEGSITKVTEFANLQSDFNIIVNKLNDDATVDFDTYTESTGETVFEVLIDNITVTTNLLTTRSNAPFIFGNLVIYKGIRTEILWAPQHFGDPSVMKQVSEGTIMFEENTITSGTLSYNTDLELSFSEVDITADNVGLFGQFVWGDVNWGGKSNSAPIRVLIPTEKQRCRYINKKFIHVNSREQYAILGASLKPRIISERAYR